MRMDFRHPLLQFVLVLLAGLGLGLTYSWKISPVTYVDASPALLRDDFKDQYRLVIAASYASTHDVARARARLELLGDADMLGALSAQAQRMLASSESFERVRSLAQLATDLQQGFASVPFTNTAPAIAADTLAIETPIGDQPPLETELPVESPIPFDQTPLSPAQIITVTPRATITPIPAAGPPFTLVGQDTVCDSTLTTGLLQINLLDSRRHQMPGVKIIVTWENGESDFYSGLKPELGNGYADFLMQADRLYSIRVVEGGAFVANITAPTCTDGQGASHLGGLLLTFQQSQ